MKKYYTPEKVQSLLHEQNIRKGHPNNIIYIKNREAPKPNVEKATQQTIDVNALVPTIVEEVLKNVPQPEPINIENIIEEVIKRIPKQEKPKEYNQNEISGNLALIDDSAQITTTKKGITTARVFVDNTGVVISSEGKVPITLRNGGVGRLKINNDGSVTVGRKMDGDELLKVNGSLKTTELTTSSLNPKGGDLVVKGKVSFNDGIVSLPHIHTPENTIDGDIWTESSGVYAKINGVIVGPLSTQYVPPEPEPKVEPVVVPPTIITNNITNSVANSSYKLVGKRTFSVGSGTNDEVSFMPGVFTGTQEFVADDVKEGSVIRITAKGFFKCEGTPKVTYKIKFGDVIVLSSQSLPCPSTNGSFMPFEMKVTCIVKKVGDAGSIASEGGISLGPTSYYGTKVHFIFDKVITNTVNTSISNNIDTTIQYGTASNGNALQISQFLIEHLKP